MATTKLGLVQRSIPVATAKPSPACKHGSAKPICHIGRFSCQSHENSGPKLKECSSKIASAAAAVVFSGMVALGEPACAVECISTDPVVCLPDNVQLPYCLIIGPWNWSEIAAIHAMQCDTARALPSAERDSLSRDLKSFERQSGWKIRVLTKFADEKYPSGDEVSFGLLDMWQVSQSLPSCYHTCQKDTPDNGGCRAICQQPAGSCLQGHTHVTHFLSLTYVVFQPKDCSCGSQLLAQHVKTLLKRPFFTELQSRFGNQFFVRDNGQEEAVLESIGALKTCLAGGGCVVVPGLDPSHYFFTLIMTVAGGLVLGFSTRLDPRAFSEHLNCPCKRRGEALSFPVFTKPRHFGVTSTGFAQRRWVPPLLLSPLWGSLFISYGLGPVVTRTSDIAPLAANCATFLLVATAVYLLPRLGSQGSVAEALLEPSERNRQEDAE
eukprot:scaffold32245_cov49-Prasinocladus_malaysianus.AAC.2